MRGDQETRVLRGVVEFRSSVGDGVGVLQGYASVFGKLSENLGGFREQVDPAAFNKSLADSVPVVARFNHSDDMLLGTTEAGTLRLSKDSQGLRYEVDLPDTQAGRDVAALAKRGDLRYSSFAFRTISDDWESDDSSTGLVRTLLSVQLLDVAPVVSPAYRDTTAGMRSLANRTGVAYEQLRSAVDAGRPLLPLVGEYGPQRPEIPSLEILRRKLDLLTGR